MLVTLRGQRVNVLYWVLISLIPLFVFPFSSFHSSIYSLVHVFILCPFVLVFFGCSSVCLFLPLFFPCFLSSFIRFVVHWFCCFITVFIPSFFHSFIPLSLYFLCSSFSMSSTQVY